MIAMMTEGPETIRTANRLAANEGLPAILVGLAVHAAGRPAVHLDRDDAIVPVAGRSSWGPDAGSVVEVSGNLRRHASQNDPVTGLSSLELSDASVRVVALPDDGVVRTAPALAAAVDSDAEVEGMAYRSSNGNIVVLSGGLAYVHGLPDWDKETVTKQVRVRGRVRHGELPPEAPPAGGSWVIEVPDGTFQRA